MRGKEKNSDFNVLEVMQSHFNTYIFLIPLDSCGITNYIEFFFLFKNCSPEQRDCVPQGWLS